MQIQPFLNAAPGLVVDLDGSLNPATDVLLNGLPLVSNSFVLAESGYFEIKIIPIPCLYRIVTVEPTAVRASLRKIEQDDSSRSGSRMAGTLPTSYARGQAASLQADSRFTVQVDRAVLLNIEAMLPSGLFGKVAELPATAAGFWSTSRFNLARGLHRFRMSITLTDSPLSLSATPPSGGGTMATGQTYAVIDSEAPAV